MGSLRVRQDWATSLSLFTFMHWRRKWQGNAFRRKCLENPWDGGAWWAAIYGVSQSRTRLKWLSSSSSIMEFMLREVKVTSSEKLLAHIASNVQGMNSLYQLLYSCLCGGRGACASVQAHMQSSCLEGLWGMRWLNGAENSCRAKQTLIASRSIIK